MMPKFCHRPLRNQDQFSLCKTAYNYSHIWADLAIYKHMATLKMKSDLILLLGKLKNL